MQGMAYARAHNHIHLYPLGDALSRAHLHPPPHIHAQSTAGVVIKQTHWQYSCTLVANLQRQFCGLPPLPLVLPPADASKPAGGNAHGVLAGGGGGGFGRVNATMDSLRNGGTGHTAGGLRAEKQVHIGEGLPPLPYPLHHAAPGAPSGCSEIHGRSEKESQGEPGGAAAGGKAGGWGEMKGQDDSFVEVEGVEGQ